MIKIRNNSGSVITVPTLKGVDGKSAYEYAKEAGFEGTEQEFINLLIDATDIINEHMSDDEAHADIRELVRNSNSSLEETKDSIGDLNELDTFNKEDLVSAVNEVKESLENINILAGAVVVNEDYSDATIQKRYILRQNDAIIGSIDIPKDMVVRSGAIVVDPINQEPGTYLQLSISNVNDPVYINIGSLINSYTTNKNPDKIKLDIDIMNSTINATIVPGGVKTEDIADGAIVTDKIADAGITKDKLSLDIQKSLAKADAATSYAKSYTDAKFNSIVGEGASETLDTIGEISKAIEDNTDIIDTLNKSIGNKVDKIDGKELSTNDYTDADKNKLNTIQSGAEVNQNAFSTITVGDTVVSAGSKSSNLNIVSGINTSVVADPENSKVIISMAMPINPTAEVISALPVGGMYLTI